MVSSYEIFPEQGLVVERVGGSMDLESTRAYLERRDGDPRMAGIRRGLLDVRGVTMDFPAAEVEGFRALYRELGEGIGPRRWAVVADSHREVALLLLLRNTWREIGLDVEVFSTEEAAYRFLGL